MRCRAQIGETTDALSRLEGDLTIVQDGNSEASKELSALEREAKELNLTLKQLHRQLDILKNSNFLGKNKREVVTSDVPLLSALTSTPSVFASPGQEYVIVYNPHI